MKKSTPTSPVKRETKPSAEALSHMRAGDVLVVRRLPRLRRSLRPTEGGGPAGRKGCPDSARS
jgi:hypothetical protein